MGEWLFMATNILAVVYMAVGVFIFGIWVGRWVERYERELHDLHVATGKRDK